MHYERLPGRVEYRRKYMAAYRQRPEIRAAKRAKAKHGLTPEAEQAFLTKQAGQCANTGCGYVFDDDFHVDHDHVCCEGRYSCGERIRGLLCRRCNNLIGFSHEDPAALIGAAEYLRNQK
jgi:hypothetical protein